MVVGSKQHTCDGYKTSDGSSLMVTTYSIFFTGVIEANEKQAMSTIDVGNTFMQGDNDEQFLVLLCNKVAKLMVRVNLILYRPYITY